MHPIIVYFIRQDISFSVEELSTHKKKGSKRSMINQFRDISNNYNRMRGLISKELGNGNIVYEYNDDSTEKDLSDKNLPIVLAI